MRWDMYEVIIERPRGGLRGRPKGGGRERMRERADPERMRLQERISMSHGTKFLNENLAPLRRFLLSRVGQRWDDVYSEICATLKGTSAVQKHVLDHLREMVHTRVVKAGDLLLQHGPQGVRELHGDRWARVYVCPDSGILKRAPPRLRSRTPVAQDVVAIDGAGQYRKLGGLWFKITLSPVPREPAAWAAARDLLLGELQALGWRRDALLREHYGRSDRYATSKRQIGKQELRRLRQEVGE